MESWNHRLYVTIKSCKFFFLAWLVDCTSYKPLHAVHFFFNLKMIKENIISMKTEWKFQLSFLLHWFVWGSSIELNQHNTLSPIVDISYTVSTTKFCLVAERVPSPILTSTIHVCNRNHESFGRVFLKFFSTLTSNHFLLGLPWFIYLFSYTNRMYVCIIILYGIISYINSLTLVSFD